MDARFPIQKKKVMNDSFHDIINSDKPVLLDFYATWCGPCQMLGPILTHVKESLGDRVIILKVDVDKNQEVVAKHRIKSVPTLILFQNGMQLWRHSGVLSKEEIIEAIFKFSN